MAVNEKDGQVVDNLFDLDSGNRNVHQLPWTVRDRLILTFNECSRFLVGETMNEDVKQALSKKLLKLNKTMFYLAQFRDAISSNDGPASDRAVLVITDRQKTKVSAILLARWAVLSGSLSTEERKLDLVDRNNDLIRELLDLPVHIFNCPISRSKDDGESNCSDRKFD